MSAEETKESNGNNSGNGIKQEGEGGLIGTTSVADFKPGQKYPTPSPGNGDRVFYETLLEQRPDSEMAQEWCVAYGVLDYNRASEINIIICKRKGKPIPLNTKAKKVSNTKVNSNNKRKRIQTDDDIVGDTGFDSAGGWEAQGTTTL